MTIDNEDYGKEVDPEGRQVHRIVRNYVNSPNQSNIEGGPDKDSRDDNTQLDSRICAWNNSVTEAINWVEPSKVPIRASQLDITMIDKEDAPMELQEVIDEPSIGCSTDIENKE